jgi:hypothetical protein
MTTTAQETARVNIWNFEIVKETEKAIIIKTDVSASDETIERGTKVRLEISIPKSLITREDLSFRSDLYIAHIPMWFLLKKRAEIKDELLYNPKYKEPVEYGINHDYEIVANNQPTFWY